MARFKLAALAAACAITIASIAIGAASAAGTRGTDVKPTIVLVHGAFADASGWSGVIARLDAKGYSVLAPANPLRGVDSDAAYVKSVLARITGPIVLVGHSYG